MDQNPLAGKSLRQDARIAEAKRLLQDCLRDHQKSITGVRPPNPQLMATYEESMEAFAKVRGGKLWYPYIGSGIGHGPLVELADGSVKYDFICGIGVHLWGHSHPDLLDSGIDAALGDTVMQGNLQQNHESFDLCKLLTDNSDFDSCIMSTSGAMACENALKIAFQNRHPARRILAFEGCFMGRTTTLSQITDKALYRAGLPGNLLVDYLPFFDPENPQESTARALEVLRGYLKRYPDDYAAFVFEPIQGEGGFNVGAAEFFKALFAELRKAHILIIADEVQTFGRTQQLFAIQTLGLEGLVDIVTLGKLSQVCATLYREDLQPKKGLISQTFTSSTSAIHASLTIIRGLLEGNFFGDEGKNQAINRHLRNNMEDLSRELPISGPYGLGTMFAFTPFGGDPKKVIELSHKLFENGLICFTCGSSKLRIRFLVPAGAVEMSDLDKACDIVASTMSAMLGKKTELVS